MSGPVRRARKRWRPRRGRDRYRDAIAVAIAMALVGLGAYFLSGSHAASPYADTGAENKIPAGNTCAKPRAIPMNPGNAQSGVTKGR